MNNILINDGFINAFAGMFIVFAGLCLIAVVIVIFNYVMQPSEKKPKAKKLIAPEEEAIKAVDIKPIPEDHLVAISAAIELYRRVHFDVLQSEITFVRGGDAQNAWKMGSKYGQRDL